MSVAVKPNSLSKFDSSFTKKQKTEDDTSSAFAKNKKPGVPSKTRVPKKKAKPASAKKKKTGDLPKEEAAPQVGLLSLIHI